MATIFCFEGLECFEIAQLDISLNILTKFTKNLSIGLNGDATESECFQKDY